MITLHNVLAAIGGATVIMLGAAFVQGAVIGFRQTRNRKGNR